MISGSGFRTAKQHVPALRTPGLRAFVTGTGVKRRRAPAQVADPPPRPAAGKTHTSQSLSFLDPKTGPTMALTGALRTPQKCFVNAAVRLSAEGAGGLGEQGPW